MMKSLFTIYVFSSNCFFGLGGNGEGRQKMRDLEAKLVWEEANYRKLEALSAPSLNLKSLGWEKGMSGGMESSQRDRGVFWELPKPLLKAATTGWLQDLSRR